jgi:hypothetical protein
MGGCGQICCHDACVYTDDYNCGGCGMACTSPMVCVHNVPFGIMNIRCGTDGMGMMEACDAPTDAAPDDAGGMSFVDADVDADVDAGVEAGTDDASIDAFVDPG